MAGEPTITLVGHVGNDPDLRFMPDGTPVCSFGVANNERKLINGEWQDIRKNWYKITAWRNIAESAAEHITKGTRVIVVGKLSFSEYEKDGERKTAPEVNADIIGIVPKGVGKKEAPKQDGSPW